MRRRFVSLLLAPFALAACSGSSGSDGASYATTGDALAAVDPADDAAFRDALSQMYSAIDAPLEAEQGPAGSVATRSLRPQSGLFDAAKKKICVYLKPLEQSPAFEHPYFYVGASLHAAGFAGAIGGVDAVWDLFDQQAAAFYYAGVFVETGISLGETASAGVGFGVKPNVLEAWSGTFQNAGVELEVPFVDWFGAGVGYFRSPDKSIQGVNGTVSLSQGLLAAPITVTVGTGEWTPYDAGTEKLATGTHGFPTSTLEHMDRGGTSQEYIQYHAALGSSAKLGAVSLGAALVRSVGNDPRSTAAAELAVAIGVWRDTSKVITAMCP